ncbi:MULTISPECIES: hypothetical protein [Crateriforma]|uniref:Secreted protein n=1 Tax=Crateriforma conspicua TaxID=2527996 RepID=A0A5C6FX88_9PLAN|nr:MULTISPECIES: hypothetical protein [Crateriforma]TWU65653.1 hypothetical protein V7x_12010 [Crateriforma conspicua]
MPSFKPATAFVLLSLLTLFSLGCSGGSTEQATVAPGDLTEEQLAEEARNIAEMDQ